jgi:hypothetical protein
MIIVSSVLSLAANAWQLTVWFHWLFYSLWLPLPENWWFDYSVFSIEFGWNCLKTNGFNIVTSQLAFGCHCLRIDCSIILPSILALAANVWQLTVWFHWLFYSLWLPLADNCWFSHSVFSIEFGSHCPKTEGLIIVNSLLSLAAVSW